MKRKAHQDHFDSRRSFLCKSACASMGVTGIVNTLAHLRLVSGAMAAGPLNDYKSLVCLFLYGGNDSNNMLVPGNGVARTNYDGARPTNHSIHIGAPGSGINEMLTLNALNASAQPNATQFGLHYRLPKLRTAFDQGDAAFICNVGTLVQPVTRATYQAGTVPLPPQLFSHSDQQVQWQSSVPDKPFTTGWGGRVADLLNAAQNPNGEVSMNISISGQNSFQVGSNVAQYAVTTNGVTNLAGYYNSSVTPGPGVPERYNNAIADITNGVVNYKTNDPGKTLKGFDQVMNLVHDHLLEEGYNSVMRNSRAVAGTLGTALSADDSAIDTAFSNQGASGGLADQLKMVARLMQGRDELCNQRQIFFVSLGGWDTHQTQASGHEGLFSQLDNALAGFRDAVQGMGLWNDTLLFSHSDFARTMQPNGDVGDGGAGTDHGWGGHQIAMGGPVIGQNIYGTYPNLVRGENPGSIDTDNSRGRWIPDLAVDQYASVVAKWFGVSNSDIATIFPNLSRFQDPNVVIPELSFLDFSV
jgi:uncharacterized protein (DUF1501 family)